MPLMAMTRTIYTRRSASTSWSEYTSTKAAARWADGSKGWRIVSPGIGYKARTVRESLLERYATETLPVDIAESIAYNPSKLLDYKEFLGGLGRAFARLPERQADVMILIHLKEHSLAEVAEILKLKATTVRSNRRHAKRSLRRMLEDGKHDLP